MTIKVRNIKSEILFNRSLLWMVLAGLDDLNGSPKWVIALQVACAVYNLWKSYEARDE